jgi:hypothetical protein
MQVKGEFGMLWLRIAAKRLGRNGEFSRGKFAPEWKVAWKGTSGGDIDACVGFGASVVLLLLLQCLSENDTLWFGGKFGGSARFAGRDA